MPAAGDETGAHAHPDGPRAPDGGGSLTTYYSSQEDEPEDGAHEPGGTECLPT